MISLRFFSIFVIFGTHAIVRVLNQQKTLKKIKKCEQRDCWQTLESWEDILEWERREKSEILINIGNSHYTRFFVL